MECIQETTNKSVQPIREYIVIEEFAKTMEMEQGIEMFYLIIINCNISHVSTDNTLSWKTKSLKHENISVFMLFGQIHMLKIYIVSGNLG